jgi:hypothetical protein
VAPTANGGAEEEKSAAAGGSIKREETAEKVAIEALSAEPQATTTGKAERGKRGNGGKGKKRKIADD